ncbi:MAG TPA: hypothetical protein ENH39_05245 [Gammaproteobacteria bacterium]|nr:hypothetical protein [Gammaproteobacteria bacterium]
MVSKEFVRRKPGNKKVVSHDHETAQIQQIRMKIDQGIFRKMASSEAPVAVVHLMDKNPTVKGR